MNTIVIACSIFKIELEHLKRQGKLNVPIVYLNSMLHMYPQQLQQLLDAQIQCYSQYNIVLIFGDCHARMVDYEKNPHIRRTQGINCCEIFLGTENYRRLREQGAFILLPEWLERWQEVFMEYMGFKNAQSTQLFMKDMHQKLVYIDTGFQTCNTQVLQQVADFLGLPLEVYSSSIDELEKLLSSLIPLDTQ